MKRLRAVESVTRICLALVAGLVLSYAVAVACLLNHSHPHGWHWDQVPEMTWLWKPPASWPQEPRIATNSSSSPGVTVEARGGRLDGENVFQAEFSVGWPLRILRVRGGDSLVRVLWSEPASPSRIVQVDPEESIMWVRMPWQSTSYPVPLRVVPMNLIWNSGFYAIVGSAAWIMLRTLRRWTRRRAGRCISCGYEMGNLPICPECGTSRAIRLAVCQDTR